MNLFLIKGSTVTPTPEALLVPEFRLIWDNDYTGRKKLQALEEFAYVYFMMDYQSPYRAYSIKERKAIIRKDIIKTRQKWIEGDDIKAAMEKYDKLQQTPSLRFLQVAEAALEKIIERIEQATKDDRFDLGKVPGLIKSIGETRKLLTDIHDLEEKVKKERAMGTTIRGGGHVNPYET